MTHELHYIPPQWCKLHPIEHYDGMGGCWGVSHELVLEQGMLYCKSCEHFDKKYPKVIKRRWEK